MVPNSRGLTSTTLASSVCAPTTPNTAIGSVGEGVVTWRLPRPARSVAALVAQPPTSVNLNELVVNRGTS